MEEERWPCRTTRCSNVSARSISKCPAYDLTLEQAQRLLGVERTLCKAVLDTLVEAKFLCLKLNGAYARRTDGEVPRPRPAKVDIVARSVETAS